MADKMSINLGCMSFCVDLISLCEILLVALIDTYNFPWFSEIPYTFCKFSFPFKTVMTSISTLTTAIWKWNPHCIGGDFWSTIWDKHLLKLSFGLDAERSRFCSLIWADSSHFRCCSSVQLSQILAFPHYVMFLAVQTIYSMNGSHPSKFPPHHGMINDQWSSYS